MKKVSIVTPLQSTRVPMAFYEEESKSIRRADDFWKKFDEFFQRLKHNR